MKVKKRMKMIPPCYRKRGSRNTSNYSLSQLLEIGSFKKRINDLKMNNRLLTSALQESRIEAAFQSNLLKDYARDSNQILFARIKLNEMVKNLAKFAADLEDVRKCLDVSLPAEYNFFQEKGSSNEQIIKIPDVSCIEEEPELHENEDSDELHENPSVVSEINLDENVASVNHNIEITPILFVDDAQEIKKKRSSSVDKGSLTPQLNVDLVCIKQKRSTRSRGKTPSFGRKKSTSRELVTHLNTMSTPQMPQIQNPMELNKILKSPPHLVRKRSTSRELVTHINDLSPPQMPQAEDPVELNEVLKSPCFGRKRSMSSGIITLNTVSPPLMHKLQDPVEMNKTVFKDPFNLQKKESENIKIPFKNHSNESGHDGSLTLQSSDLILNGKLPDVSNTDLNIYSEIDKVCLLQPQNNENNLPFVTNLEDNSIIDRSMQEKNETFLNDILNSENNSQNSTDISQSTPSVLHDVQPPEMHEYAEEIKNVGSLTFCDSDEDDCEQKNLVSPLVRSTRSKTPLKYTDFFLSDDDDDIDSPFKLAATKRYGTKSIKLTSSTGKSCEKTLTENADEISSDVKKEITEADYSVYNLDVSNSKKTRKKYKKKTIAKSQNKKILNAKPRPLFQKCSVLKLKGGKLEFSKCEKATEQKSTDKYSEKSLQNSCVSPGGILKRSSLVLNCEDKQHETSLSEIKNADNKHQSMLQTPKRVSFAPTDLVCKFEKMSESKAIADNKKVRRTSKSFIDLKDLFDKADQSPPVATNNSFEKTGIQKPGSVLFDFSDDTEMYTFTFPSNMQLPLLPTDDIDTSKSSTPKLTDNNKKVKRASKSAIELKDLFQKADQSKTPPAATANSSEKTDVQKPSSVLFDFSSGTEQAQILASDNDMTSNPLTSEISEQAKLQNNENDKYMKNSPTTSNNPKSTEKLSLKRNDKALSNYCSENYTNNKYIEKSPTTLKSPKNIQKLSLKLNKIAHKTAPERNSNSAHVSETAGTIIDILLLESPMSFVKVPKRKSLFKESQDDGSKENINIDQLVAEKKDSLKNKKSSLSTPKVGFKKSSCSKSQSKVHSKISAKKNKKINLETKSLEQSPVLADATNIKVESHSRRRSKQVSYKEPNLNKKLRRT